MGIGETIAKGIDWASTGADVAFVAGLLDPSPVEEMVTVPAVVLTKVAKLVSKALKLAPGTAKVARAVGKGSEKVIKGYIEKGGLKSVMQMAVPEIEAAAKAAGHEGSLSEFVKGVLTKGGKITPAGSLAPSLQSTAQAATTAVPEVVEAVAKVADPEVVAHIGRLTKAVGPEETARLISASGAKGFKITKNATPEVVNAQLEAIAPLVDKDKLLTRTVGRLKYFREGAVERGAKLTDAQKTMGTMQEQLDSAKPGLAGKVMHGLGYATTIAMLAQLAGQAFGGSSQPDPAQLQAMLGMGGAGEDLKEENMRLKNMMLMAKLAEQAEKNNNDLGGSLPRLF